MAREKDEREYVTEKMNVTRRKDSRYSNSHVRPGEFSPLTRSDEDELGHVTLSPIDEDSSSSYYEPVYIYEASETPQRSKEQEEWDEFVRTVVRELVLIAIERGTPHARRLWLERVRPALTARAERRRERRALRRQRRAEKKSGVIEAAVMAPAQDIAVVAHEFKTNMSSTEAQARYLMALAARRFADEQMRLLADADIDVDEGRQELEQALSELPSEQVVRMLQRFEADPSLLTGDALTGLGMILGVERADGPLTLEERRP